MRYLLLKKFFILSLFLSPIFSLAVHAQAYTVSGSVGNSGDYAHYNLCNGNYFKESYEINSKLVFKHATENFWIYYDITLPGSPPGGWLIDDDTDASDYGGFFYVTQADLPPVGVLYARDLANGDNPMLANLASNITFTDGSTFSQSITPNSFNQIIGRYQLAGDISIASLTATSIKLNGARSGLSNLKLWSSTDASFGGDTQMGSTVAVDPGDGNSVVFSGFSNAISTSGTYYFLTGDVADGASGTAQGVIVQNSSLTITNGTLSGTITNALLSGNAAPLPVELTYFTTSIVDNKVILNWQTATEVNNYGFSVERSQKTEVGSQNNWIEIGFVEGRGNSNSTKQYSFIDKDITNGSYSYRLKQIDIDGSYSYSNIVEVTSNMQPSTFELFQNYPNPFNPTTVISYQLSVVSKVQLKVYDILGNEVATLVNETKEPGVYEVEFDGTELSSGIYFYQLQTDNGLNIIKKLVLVK